jgi:hypothetical protein
MITDPTAYANRAPGEKIYRQYVVLSRAWYGEASLQYMRKEGVVDQISVGHYSSGGGTTGEFIIEQHRFNQPRHGQLAVRVCLFDDAWHLLVHEAELFRRIGELPEGSSFEDVERVLQEVGFVDATPAERR